MLIYVTFLSDRAVLCIRHSKTQYNEHTLDIPIPHITDSVTCPAKALLFVYKLTSSDENQSPVFSYPVGTKVRAYTYQTFQSRLELILSDIGVDNSQYAGHSFRRGGASFAFSSR